LLRLQQKILVCLRERERDTAATPLRNTTPASGLENATGGRKSNSMKNQLFAIALGGVLAISANAALYAQEQAPETAGPRQGQWGHGRGHYMDPDRQLAHLTKTLNLSADQQAQIKPILLDRQQKMQSLFQDQSLAPQDRHSKAMAIRQDTTTRLEATLNDQQKAQFEEMRAKMQAHRHHGMGGENQSTPRSAPQPE